MNVNKNNNDKKIKKITNKEERISDFYSFFFLILKIKKRHQKYND